MSRPSPLRSRAKGSRASKGKTLCSRTTESDRQGQVLAASPSAPGCPSGKPKTHREQSGLVTVRTHGGASRHRALTVLRPHQSLLPTRGQQSKESTRIQRPDRSHDHKIGGQAKAKKKDMQKTRTSFPSIAAAAPRRLPPSTTTVTSARSLRQRWGIRVCRRNRRPAGKWTSTSKSPPPRPVAGSQPQGSLFAQ